MPVKSLTTGTPLTSDVCRKSPNSGFCHVPLKPTSSQSSACHVPSTSTPNVSVSVKIVRCTKAPPSKTVSVKLKLSNFVLNAVTYSDSPGAASL